MAAPGRSRRAGALALGLALLLGVGLRGANLAHSSLWVDEAESCINALTILADGLPGSHYQGQPIFENTLTQSSLSEEYEFDDSSYSARGLAVYHGWMPLYAIAAAYALAGIRPDPPPERLEVSVSPAQARTRTLAARLPSVLFGLLMLLLLYGAAREMYGLDAAWAALIGGVLARPLVVYARQARYYSATAALSVACCWCAYRLLRRGLWRDVIACALCLVLLFHTHMLSFAVGLLTLVVSLPLLRPRPRLLLQVAAFAALVGLGTLPWLVWTGYLAHTDAIPRAWRLLDFPAALLDYPREKPLFSTLLVVAWCAFAWAVSQRKHASARLRAIWLAPAPAVRILSAWIVLGFLGFTLAMPAASYFLQRLTLLIAGPALLLGAITIAAAARTLAPRLSLELAAAGGALAAFLLGGTHYPWLVLEPPESPALEAVEHLRGLGELPQGTRIYATPNEHLPLALYSGLPIQCVAPVRRAFLERHRGALLVIEAVARYDPIPADALRAELARVGGPTEGETFREQRRALSSRLVHADVTARAASVEPRLGPAPEFLPALLDLQRAHTAERTRGRRNPERDNPAVFRGHRIDDWTQWWQVFFYRFVDPASRSGAQLNYAGRIRSARAVVLRSTWVVFHCPPLAAREGE